MEQITPQKTKIIICEICNCQVEIPIANHHRQKYCPACSHFVSKIINNQRLKECNLERKKLWDSLSKDEQLKRIKIASQKILNKNEIDYMTVKRIKERKKLSEDKLIIFQEKPKRKMEDFVK